MSLGEKIGRVYQQEGLQQLLRSGVRYTYRQYVLPWAPKRVVKYNAVDVHAGTPFDEVVPWIRSDRPTYETALLDGIRSEVQSGSEVVVVGGGWGVSTVVAARRVGDEGSVTVFEAGDRAYRRLKKTVELNDVADRVTAKHAVVGESINLRGETTAEQIPADQLPSCDVLVLDCEGAETGIIRRTIAHPRCMIVETHGHLGASSRQVRTLLNENDYDISDSSIAETERKKMCENNDILVLVAHSTMGDGS